MYIRVRYTCMPHTGIVVDVLYMYTYMYVRLGYIFILFNSSYDYWIGLTLPWKCSLHCQGSAYLSADACVGSEAVDPQDTFAARCCACRGRWVWIDGVQSSYSNWDPFRPYNRLCGKLKLAHNGFLWSDGYFLDYERYICKRRIEVRPTYIMADNGKQLDSIGIF